eukprot:scaffold109663_cov63-Phaeocystis_antarctica.AAC.2
MPSASHTVLKMSTSSTGAATRAPADCGSHGARSTSGTRAAFSHRMPAVVGVHHHQRRAVELERLELGEHLSRGKVCPTDCGVVGRAVRTHLRVGVGAHVGLIAPEVLPCCPRDRIDRAVERSLYRQRHLGGRVEVRVRLGHAPRQMWPANSHHEQKALAGGGAVGRVARRRHRGVGSVGAAGRQLGRAQLDLVVDIRRAAVKRVHVPMPRAARVRRALEELQVPAVAPLLRLQVAVLHAHVRPRGRVGLGRQACPGRVACIADHAEPAVSVVEVLTHAEGEPPLLAQVLGQRRPLGHHAATLAADAHRRAIVGARRAACGVERAEEQARVVAHVPSRASLAGVTVRAALRATTRVAGWQVSEGDAASVPGAQ